MSVRGSTVCSRIKCSPSTNISGIVEIPFPTGLRERERILTEIRLRTRLNTPGPKAVTHAAKMKHLGSGGFRSKQRSTKARKDITRGRYQPCWIREQCLKATTTPERAFITSMLCETTWYSPLGNGTKMRLRNITTKQRRGVSGRGGTSAWAPAGPSSVSLGRTHSG